MSKQIDKPKNIKELTLIYHNTKERQEIRQLIAKLGYTEYLIDYFEIKYCDSLTFGEITIKFYCDDNF